MILVALALALHVGLGLLVHGSGPLGVDRAAFDLIDPLRGGSGLDVVRILTDLGSFPVSALVVAGGAVYAVRVRGLRTALGLVAAMVALLVMVNVAKEVWDRPRPVDRFYDPSGRSYPSGHSAYVTAWLAVAGLTGRRALITAATVLVVAVGASRLYLGVHYLTDVVGGMALGAAVFAPLRIRK